MIINRIGLDHYFDVILSGADVLKPKPDPEIFLLARDRCRVTSSEGVVIEDAHAGIEAARAAGMHTLGIGLAELLPTAEVVYPAMTCIRLNELRALFQP